MFRMVMFSIPSQEKIGRKPHTNQESLKKDLPLRKMRTKR